MVTETDAIVFSVFSTNNAGGQCRSLLASKHAQQQGMQGSNQGDMQVSDVMLRCGGSHRQIFAQATM